MASGNEKCAYRQCDSGAQGLRTRAGRWRPKSRCVDHGTMGTPVNTQLLPETDPTSIIWKKMTSVFQRYTDDAPDLHVQMPQRILPTTDSHYPIDVMARHLEKYLMDPSSTHERYPWAARFVMGMPVPTWARGVEWDVGLKSRFISAVWSGADLGSYLTNDWCEALTAGRALAENSEILIDGQQRLHSLEEYFLNRLAIPDAQGQPRIWSELGNSERKRFLSTIFTHARVCSGDELALRCTYDLCAQGVVPRSFDQRTSR